MDECICVWALLAFAVKKEVAKSAQQPQQVATPNWSFKSVKELAPEATASLILWSVIALQIHTYMAHLGFGRISPK